MEKHQEDSFPMSRVLVLLVVLLSLSLQAGAQPFSLAETPHNDINVVINTESWGPASYVPANDKAGSRVQKKLPSFIALQKKYFNVFENTRILTMFNAEINDARLGKVSNTVHLRNTERLTDIYLTPNRDLNSGIAMLAARVQSPRERLALSINPFVDAVIEHALARIAVQTMQNMASDKVEFSTSMCAMVKDSLAQSSARGCPGDGIVNVASGDIYVQNPALKMSNCMDEECLSAFKATWRHAQHAVVIRFIKELVDGACAGVDEASMQIDRRTADTDGACPQTLKYRDSKLLEFIGEYPCGGVDPIYSRTCLSVRRSLQVRSNPNLSTSNPNPNPNPNRAYLFVGLCRHSSPTPTTAPTPRGSTRVLSRTNLPRIGESCSQGTQLHPLIFKETLKRLVQIIKLHAKFQKITKSLPLRIRKDFVRRKYQLVWEVHFQTSSHAATKPFAVLQNLNLAQYPRIRNTKHYKGNLDFALLKVVVCHQRLPACLGTN